MTMAGQTATAPNAVNPLPAGPNRHLDATRQTVLSSAKSACGAYNCSVLHLSVNKCNGHGTPVRFDAYPALPAYRRADGG